MLNRQTILLMMCCLLIGLSSSTAFQERQDDAFKTELKAMAGTWRAVSVEKDGQKAPETILKETIMTRDESR